MTTQKTTPSPRVEEIVEEFEKLFGKFTFSNGGVLELSLWDIIDERIHKTDEVGLVINNWLHTTLTQLEQEKQQAVEEERERIRDFIKRFAKEEHIHADHTTVNDFATYADGCNHVLYSVKAKLLQFLTPNDTQ